MGEIKEDIKEILLSKRKIKKKVKKLGKQISDEYRGKNPVFVSILKGSVIFLSDLLRELKIECSVDFMAVSSYNEKTESSGVVKLIMDLRESIEGRHVLLVEDIVDTGLTAGYLRDVIRMRNPESVEICTLLSKPAARELHIECRYTGFEIPDEYVVGYGLDYSEKYRNIPYIATLKSEVYRR